MLEKKRQDYIYGINIKHIRHHHFRQRRLSNKTSRTKLSLDDLLPTQFLIPVRRLLLLRENLDVGSVLEAVLVEQLFGQFGWLRVKGLKDVVHGFFDVGDGVDGRVGEVAAELGESLQKL